MQPDSREYLIELYDLYQRLLTEKQQMYFESYYFLDLSLSEIAKKFSKISSLDLNKDQIEEILSILKE